MTIERLGCANDYQVTVHWRGGKRPFINLQGVTKIHWERRLDEVSQAEVVINKPLAGEGCCGMLGYIRPWMHEVTIYRDGVLVWQGPIVTTVEERGSLTLKCKDVLAWLDRRVNFGVIKRNSTGMDATLAAYAYVSAGFFKSYTYVTTVKGKRVKRTVYDDTNVRPFIKIYRGAPKMKTPQIRDRSHYMGVLLHKLGEEKGVDYTTVGRSIIIRPEVSATSVPYRKSLWLTDEHFSEPLRVTDDGWSIATRMTVLATGRDPEKQSGCGKSKGRTPQGGKEKPKKPKAKANPKPPWWPPNLPWPPPSPNASGYGVFPPLFTPEQAARVLAPQADGSFDAVSLAAAATLPRSADALIAVAGAQVGKNLMATVNAWYGGVAKDAPWGASFISWCAAQVDAKDSDADSEMLMSVGRFSIAAAMAQWFKSTGRWGRSPERGALAFFDWDGTQDVTQVDHVGLVTAAYTDGTFDTIEGNTEDTVARRERDIRQVVGFGYPDYPDGYDLSGSPDAPATVVQAAATLLSAANNSTSGDTIPQTYPEAPLPVMSLPMMSLADGTLADLRSPEVAAAVRAKDGKNKIPRAWQAAKDAMKSQADKNCGSKKTKQKPLVARPATANIPEDMARYGVIDALRKIDNPENKLSVKDLIPKVSELRRQTDPPRVAITAPESAVLTPDAPVTIQRLVCGWRFDIAVEDYCRPLWQPVRLSEVSVDYEADDVEKVRIAFIPLRGAREITPKDGFDTSEGVPGETLEEALKKQQATKSKRDWEDEFKKFTQRKKRKKKT